LRTVKCLLGSGLMFRNAEHNERKTRPFCHRPMSDFIDSFRGKMGVA